MCEKGKEGVVMSVVADEWGGSGLNMVGEERGRKQARKEGREEAWKSLLICLLGSWRGTFPEYHTQ